MFAASVQRCLREGAVDLAVLPGRLRAWWDGLDRPPEPLALPLPVEVEEMSAPPSVIDPDAPYWTPARIDVAQRIWGREHLRPGGEVYARYLLTPLALNPSHSVVEIGSDVGGTARLMHRSFNVYVKGFEPSPELAATAMALSTKAGLARQAAIAAVDLGAPGLKRASADRIIMRDLLHTVPDKVALLRALGEALKPKGQLLITDFVLEDGGAPDAVSLWARREPVQSHPWSLRILQEMLEDLRFTVHVVAEETPMLRHTILDGWTAFRTSLRSMPLPDHQRDVMFDEGERWARCLAALDTGLLHHVRIVVSR